MTVSLQKKTLRQKHIQGKDNHVMTAAETEVMHLQAKDPRMPANTRIKEEGRILPYGFQRKHGLANILILDFYPPELTDNKFPIVLSS